MTHSHIDKPDAIDVEPTHEPPEPEQTWRTVGISPKALAAFATPTTIGAVLLILGVVLGDSDLREYGALLIVGGGVAGAGAVAAKPGEVHYK